ncbi:MAG: acylneuraminate cytidylyltransferase family protein [bacterium]|nr:acylneuraminate cytidylyltransferase family protein [bacterium]
MYKNKTILAIIPARGGSKRIPKKNIKPLVGKPLIAYSIDAALQSKYIDRVIVSTDDKEIARVAAKRKAEIPFLRPKKLSGGKATTVSALQHAVRFLEEQENYKADIVVLIQPTTPLILSKDIDDAIKKLIRTRSNSCVSLCEISERPEWMYQIKKNKAVPFIKTKNSAKRTQDLPKTLRLNGGVYATRKDTLMKKNKIVDGGNLSAIIMPRERSIDIDEPIDFLIAEAMIKHNKNAGKKNN